MKEFWDTRYKTSDYAYGIAPNNYLKKKIEELNLKGSILLPCEGEGRNAVFAANQGLEVSAFDLSGEGKVKAMKLAKDQSVDIDYEVGEFESQSYEPNSFDVISLIYAHFPPNVRKKYHQKLVEYLKPGGVVIIEGFSQRNLEIVKTNPKVGGPQKIEMLYSTEMIESDFDALDTIELSEEIVELNEGQFHIGKGSVVRYVGRKINKK